MTSKEEGCSEYQTCLNIGCSKPVAHTTLIYFTKLEICWDDEWKWHLRKTSTGDESMKKMTVKRSPSRFYNKNSLLKELYRIRISTNSRSLSFDFYLKMCKPSKKPNLHEGVIYRRRSTKWKKKLWTWTFARHCSLIVIICIISVCSRRKNVIPPILHTCIYKTLEVHNFYLI